MPKILDVIRLYHGRITAADLSASTGSTFSESFSQLNKLAIELPAKLEVTDKGNILYCFSDTSWRSGIKRRLTASIQWLIHYLSIVIFYINQAWRFAFQIMLWFSPIPLAILTIICMTSGIPGLNYQGLRFFIPSLFFLLGCFFTENFLESCLSFICGPNGKRRVPGRWQQMAQFIRDHGGVLLAEQMIQVTGGKDINKTAFEVLVHFDGRPVVSDKGNILYNFPLLLNTSDSTVRQPGLGSSQLEEAKYQFTDISEQRYSLIQLYVMLNLFTFLGLTYLFVRKTDSFLIYFFGLQANSLWFNMLLCYCLAFSVLFLCYPVCRSLVIKALNLPIEGRNQRRRLALERVPLPILHDAYSYAKKLNDVGKDKIIYTSDKDLLEQQFET